MTPRRIAKAHQAGTQGDTQRLVEKLGTAQPSEVAALQRRRLGALPRLVKEHSILYGPLFRDMLGVAMRLRRVTQASELVGDADKGWRKTST